VGPLVTPKKGNDSGAQEGAWVHQVGGQEIDRGRANNDCEK